MWTLYTLYRLTDNGERRIYCRGTYIYKKIPDTGRDAWWDICISHACSSHLRENTKCGHTENRNTSCRWSFNKLTHNCHCLWAHPGGKQKLIAQLQICYFSSFLNFKQFTTTKTFSCKAFYVTPKTWEKAPVRCPYWQFTFHFISHSCPRDTCTKYKTPVKVEQPTFFQKFGLDTVAWSSTGHLRVAQLMKGSYM